ncbi:HAMP domain-containing sensor histidine kinase [Labedaea rhizosphaerae]|uniref:Signal transduction histidine-protein kinase/phosphatase MprB n=1 Tax=Labedaea rhizosphaerae TaxID=598644 RepID=A0A4R6RSH5_LABRH|nr:HAMP domain-containing sensor histidine kinase [Labedaea rhizosphaerae]TDP88906.1 signal transduction histidine kinase [Labedaea rhizosphaerae]
MSTRALLDAIPRPLDPIRSIKVKLGLVVVAGCAVAVLFFWWRIGWLPPQTATVAVGLGLVASQLLAHGMTRPLREMTAAARAMAHGDYTRRVRATARDEVGELATAFNQMAADLDAADRQRRELIANVSHELRTPITALRAVLENVVDGVTQPDDATLRTALAQAQRLGGLVGELLDLSRVDAGVAPLSKRRFALAPMLDDAVAEAEMRAVAAGSAARFATDVPANLHVVADRGRLHQVVANLLDNAVRHGPPGGEVRVSAAVHGDRLTIEVTDEGAGIAPDQRRLVFQRFTRGERVEGGGTGLGLAIARWAVELHGGTIAVVDPRAGTGGCRIRVTLPTT